MKKFELKHFSSYPMGENGVLVILPKHQIKYGKYHTYPLNGVSIGTTGEVVIDLLLPDGDIISSYVFDINKCKLVLRPLSDLTKEIEVNGEIINPIEEIYNDSWMALGYKVKDYGNVCIIQSNEDKSTLEIYKKKPQVNMWWVTQKLISMHFDVYGLIERGLAIDMNK